MSAACRFSPTYYCHGLLGKIIAEVSKLNPAEY